MESERKEIETEIEYEWTKDQIYFFWFLVAFTVGSCVSLLILDYLL